MNNGNSGGIRIVAILGTSRPGNFTSKALALVIDEIEKQGDTGSTISSAFASRGRIVVRSMWRLWTTMAEGAVL